MFFAEFRGFPDTGSYCETAVKDVPFAESHESTPATHPILLLDPLRRTCRALPFAPSTFIHSTFHFTFHEKTSPLIHYLERSPFIIS